MAVSQAAVSGAFKKDPSLLTGDKFKNSLVSRLNADAASKSPANKPMEDYNDSQFSQVNNQTTNTTANSVLAKPSGYGGVNQGTKPLEADLTYNYDQSVEGRIENLIKKDSQIMQLAKTDAKQAANKKGLLNSSLAVGAAQESVMRAAAPIATSDAANSLQARALVFNAKADLEKIAANIAGDSRLLSEKGYIDSMLADQNNKATLEQISKQGFVEGLLQKSKFGNDAELLRLGGIQDRYLEDTRGKNAALLAGNTSATNLTNTHTQAVTNVLLDDNMTSDQKNAAIQQLNTDWEAGLAIVTATSGVDYSAVLDFDNGGGGDYGGGGDSDSGGGDSDYQAALARQRADSGGQHQNDSSPWFYM
jgi:hypothetical protein